MVTFAHECSPPAQYVQKDDGKYYRMISDYDTIATGMDMCHDHGANLARFKSESEYKAIMSFISKITDVQFCLFFI